MKKLFYLFVFLVYNTFCYGQHRKKMPNPINLPDQVEYAPSISADGRTLIFQSSRYGLYVNAGNRVPVINAEGRQEKTVVGDMVDFPGVYETRQHSSGEWLKPEPIMSINQHGSGMAPVIGGPSISYDGNSLFYFANYNDPKEGFGREDIYYCTRTKNGWSAPINLGSEINSAGYEGFPSISPDGKQLYFVKDNLIKKAEGIEKCYRIMKSELGQDGKWKRPIELPPPVNLDCEKAPRIMADGQTLVYSAIKKGGKGDFDLYYARFREDGRWSESIPLNMINTKRSDQSVAITPCGDLMYYVSDGDIFTYAVPEELRPFKVATIQGFVTDSITGSPLKTRVVLTNIKSGIVITSIESSAIDGRFTLLAPLTSEYVVSVNEKNYRLKTSRVINSDYMDCALITRNFRLSPINVTNAAKRSDIAILSEPAKPEPTKEPEAAKPIATSDVTVAAEIQKPSVEKLVAEKEADNQINRKIIADSTENKPVEIVKSTNPTARPVSLDLAVLLRNVETDAVVTDATISIKTLNPDSEIAWTYDSTKNTYRANVIPGTSILINAAAKNYLPAELKLIDIQENKRVTIKLFELKPSVLKITVLDLKKSSALPAMVKILNIKDGKSQELELKNGTIEKLFLEPADLEVTAFAKDYTSVSKKIKIEMGPGGKIYEFEARLDRITHSLAIKVVDIDTGQEIPEARIDVKDLGNNTVTTLTSGSTEKNEILIAGQGQYEITCIVDGYNTNISTINLDKANNQVLVKIKRKPKTERHITVKITDKYTDAPLDASITFAGNKVTNHDIILNETEDEILAFQPTGYSPVSRSLTSQEIAAGTVHFQLEKAEYDFTLKALSQANHKPITNARFNIIHAESKEKINVSVSNGQATTRLSPNGKYVINVVAEGYENLQTQLNAGQALYDHNSDKELLMKPIVEVSKVEKAEPAKIVETVAFGELKKGKSITLNNIFFDQSSPVLRDESFAELDKLAAVLTENPTLRIEVRGHTDNTGNFDANVKLSRQRCEAVVNFLIDKGIAKNRLQFVGKGPIDPVAPNTTEENKKKNRRVEFVVL